MAARELGWTFYENDFHTLTDEECPYIGNQYFFRPFLRGVRASEIAASLRGERRSDDIVARHEDIEGHLRVSRVPG